jgi:probable FeS assembly SUF system protein SufT
MVTEELITLFRDCEGTAIPAGTKTSLYKDEKVYLTQTLGGSFTVQRDNGQLVRVEGKNADALGKPVPEAGGVFKINYDVNQPIDDVELEKSVWSTLKTCYDPEIPVNIVELGLIYGCQIRPAERGGRRVEVVMTLTAPGCGMSTVLKNEIEEKLGQIPGVSEAFVDVTFDPPWNQSLMTEAARLQLGMM